MGRIEETGEGGDTRYYPVSPTKFTLLSVLTFGIYVFYWFYKNWRYVGDRDQSSIWPLWRAIFHPVWCYPLIADIRANHGKKDGRLLSGGALLTVVYITLFVTIDLPNPYWLASVLAFVALLPIVLAINFINGSSETYKLNSKIRLRHLVLALVMGPAVAHIVGEAVNLVPHDEVVDGSRVPSWHVVWMVEQGILTKEETIVYFFSDGMFSFRSDGSFITDHAVGYYSREEGDIYSDFVYYEDITSIDIEYADDSFDYTTTNLKKSTVVKSRFKSRQTSMGTKGLSKPSKLASMMRQAPSAPSA